MILIDKSRWMVVNKPSGWHTLSRGDDDDASISDDAKLKDESLEAWLRRERPEQAVVPEAGIAHRLDQRTSGCILVAKNPETYLSMRELIRSEEIQKTYLALVEGALNSGEFQLYFFSRYKRSQKVTVTETGKSQIMGRCSWKTLHSTSKRSLIKIDLIGRGKRHQIRAGFAYLGHPICGDSLYGAERWKDAFGLHAWRLKWKALDVTAPVPDTWPKSFTEYIPKD